MSATVDRLQRTRPAAAVGVARILLGLLFVMTGLMKLLVPDLRAAFSGQLTAAGLPFHDLNMWLVPLAEAGIGLLLLAGLLARVASLMAIGMMTVAMYVHLVVHDPALFPLQPQAPTIPLVVIGLCGWVLWIGAGSWSVDLRSAR